MSDRPEFHRASPEALEAMMAVSRYAGTSSIEHSLGELVKIRASQINGCANCLHMHTADARKAGESEARIYLLSAWRESKMYTARERAALAWTEALTLVGNGHPSEETRAAVEAAFSPREQADLTLMICVINSWNRIAVGYGIVHPNDRAHEAKAAA